MKIVSYFMIVAVALCASASQLANFTPPTLPCAYTVFYKLYQNISGEEHTLEGCEARYGRYASMEQEMNVQGVNAKVKTILRLDMHEDGHPDGAAVVIGNSAGPIQVCKFDEYVDPYDEGYSSTSILYYALNQPFAYNAKEENVEYEGQLCTKYVNDIDPSVYAELYANSDGYIIGFNTVIEDEQDLMITNVTVTSYLMTYNEDMFMLDSSYSGCEQYSGIYSAPPEEPNCPIDSSSSSHTTSSTAPSSTHSASSTAPSSTHSASSTAPSSTHPAPSSTHPASSTAPSSTHPASSTAPSSTHPASSSDSVTSAASSVKATIAFVVSLALISLF